MSEGGVRPGKIISVSQKIIMHVRSISKRNAYTYNICNNNKSIKMRLILTRVEGRWSLIHLTERSLRQLNVHIQRYHSESRPCCLSR